MFSFDSVLIRVTFYFDDEALESGLDIDQLFRLIVYFGCLSRDCLLLFFNQFPEFVILKNKFLKKLSMSLPRISDQQVLRLFVCRYRLSYLV